MENPSKTYDWQHPQRQPLMGLAIVFVNSFWEILKATWPFLLLPLLKSNPEKPGKFELAALIFLGVTVIVSVLRFWFFKFYIENDILVIKKGWIKKETKLIPLNKIQTVNIEQGPVHQLVNIVKLSIDTAGSEATEGVIDALKKPMAEALQSRLLQARANNAEPQAAKEVLIQLTDRDLLKLSISANHIETLLVMAIFLAGLFDNLGDIGDRFLSGIGIFLPSGGTLYPIIFFSVAILMITILVSTGRIFFSFYNFRISKLHKGYQVSSGLTHVKEKTIAFQKIQYLSLKANWIRKLMRLWMLEYFVAGGDDVKKKSRIQIPVTRQAFIDPLMDAYHPLPQVTGEALRMHPAYVTRRVSLATIAAVIIISATWVFLDWSSLYFLIYPVYIAISSSARRRKFRLYASEDVVYIKAALFGEQHILFKWHKLQSVKIRESIYQRRRGLASLVFYTAGGRILVPYIPLPTAQALADFALLKTEFSRQRWI